jgi:plasmid stabilization system protein ParE
MKKYSVIFHPAAEDDIIASYQWGRRVWGEANAKVWARHLRRTIFTRLGSFPLGCPIAPESEELGTPIRQLVIQRYRVLFIVEKRTVTILHVRGAWLGAVGLREFDEEQNG